MSVLAAALVIPPVFLLVRERQARGQGPESLLNYLSRAHTASLLGQDPRSLESATSFSDLHARLLPLFLEARHQGLALGTCMPLLNWMAGESTRLDRARWRLVRLVVARFLMGAALAWGGRLTLFFLSPAAADSHTLVLDFFAQILALIIFCGSLWGFHRYLPRIWSWSASLSEDGLRWMERVLFPSSPTSEQTPAGSILTTLTRREWETGVSHASEKREALRQWAEEKFGRDHARLEASEEWLPLLELGGVGLCVSLMLATSVASLIGA